MNDDRRKNWKENLSAEAGQRMQRKLELLSQLDELRTQLRACGTDFVKRDAVALEYRVTVATLATI